MTIELLNNAWYRLPDGTRVQARRSKTPSLMWPLVNADGTMPLYGFIVDSEKVGAFRWEPAPSGYRITACDLTTDDLLPEDQK